MATKKVKRQRALEKREKFMAEYRRTGLEAQKRDQDHRAFEAERIQRKNHKKHEGYLDADCSLCKEKAALDA